MVGGLSFHVAPSPKLIRPYKRKLLCNTEHTKILLVFYSHKMSLCNLILNQDWFPRTNISCNQRLGAFSGCVIPTKMVRFKSFNEFKVHSQNFLFLVLKRMISLIKYTVDCFWTNSIVMYNLSLYWCFGISQLIWVWILIYFQLSSLEEKKYQMI